MNIELGESDGKETERPYVGIKLPVGDGEGVFASTTIDCVSH